MSDKGYILTNYHVVANADQIIVALQDGRVLTADLIGSDIPTDLAVLGISSDNLPVIPQNEGVTLRLATWFWQLVTCITLDKLSHRESSVRPEEMVSVRWTRQ